MSAQFGKFNFDGKPIDPKDLDQVREVLAPYGPDGEGYICKDHTGILYRALNTTKESRLERQPFVGPLGEVITWDGRLDNREELLGELACELSTSSTDVSIVAKSYERWGTDAFARLIGDWAVSIVDPAKRSVILAKDFVGTRPLYYSVEKDQLTWCTVLDPLVLFANRSFALEEEYIAGWLSFFPAPHLSPYVGIHSVPPSTFVRVRPGNRTIEKYWAFDQGNRIRYQADSEYEEHFRIVFSEAVRRRLRADSPVLAELSGGLDSSSIVCIGDGIVARGTADAPRIDTVSYYDDSEPSLNERNFFTRIEEQRGRMGCHIDVSCDNSLVLPIDGGGFSATPASGDSRLSEAGRKFIDCMEAGASRVLLSGIGGDEVTGGVPTPRPEIEDLLARARFRALAHQLKAWALVQRRPWIHLLLEAIRAFMPPAIVSSARIKRPAPWLVPTFVRRYRTALGGYEGRLHLGSLPSFQENLSTLDHVRRLLACTAVSCKPAFEKRYPYLDRDFLVFLYAIPRDQVVRPGQRRSLMRRSLVGIVPDEVLNRRRKAFVSRQPRVALSREWRDVERMATRMVTASLGILSQRDFLEALEQARQGGEVPMVPLLRTVSIEQWLLRLQSFKLVRSEPATGLMVPSVARDYV